MIIDAKNVISETQNWLERVVIGLNLCPFAKAVHTKGLIQYVVSSAQTAADLLVDFKLELSKLAQADPAQVDTTLLIHPQVLTTFLDYNEFLQIIDDVLNEMNLTGKIQVASFHPFYQFDGTEPNDIENYTNRSPYPILQLLRETSVEKALENYSNPDEIFEKNIETLRELGHAGWQKLKTHQGN